MATTTTKPAAKPAAKAEAARKEATGEQPVADFRGIKITLPAKLPASFPLRLGRLQRSDEEAAPEAIYGLVVAIVGDEQLEAVMDKMDELDVDFNAALEELVNALVAPYGAQPGESNASGDS